MLLAGLTLYLSITLLIGVMASRRATDLEGYLVAGRQLPTWLCTSSLVATWFGAGTCVGAAGAAMKGGMAAVIADPYGAALCLLLAGLLVVAPMRRLGLLTIGDYFARRYGPRVERMACLCLIPAYIGWTGSQFLAFGIILDLLADVPLELAVVVGATITIAYTMMGGMWSVAVTDAVQTIALLVGMVVLLVATLAKLGGIEAALYRVPDEMWDLLPPDMDASEGLTYLQAWLVIGLGSLPGQDLVQRALSAKDERTARRSAVLAGMGYLALGLIPVLIGILGGLLQPELSNPEHIIPSLALELLPPLAAVLVLGALVSAILSSADSALLAPASIIGWNIIAKRWPQLSERWVLSICRLSVLGIGAIALVLALVFSSVYALMVASWSVLLVSLVVPLLGGLLSSRADERAAIAAIVVGLVSWGLLSALLDTLPADLLAFGLSLMSYLGLAYARRADPEPKTTIGLVASVASVGSAVSPGQAASRVSPSSPQST